MSMWPTDGDSTIVTAMIEVYIITAWNKITFHAKVQNNKYDVVFTIFGEQNPNMK